MSIKQNNQMNSETRKRKWKQSDVQAKANQQKNSASKIEPFARLLKFILWRCKLFWSFLSTLPLVISISFVNILPNRTRNCILWFAARTKCFELDGWSTTKFKWDLLKVFIHSSRHAMHVRWWHHRNWRHTIPSQIRELGETQAWTHGKEQKRQLKCGAQHTHNQCRFHCCRRRRLRSV